jgi:phage/plasmid-like protein (TIGR03299 family)
MSANLDRNEVTGQASFVGRESAWHQGGIVRQDHPLKFEETLALGGLDFPVGTRSLRVVMNDDPDIAIDAPSGKAVVRLDRPTQEGILGIVGDGYVPMQDRVAFGVLEPLLDLGLAEITTAGALDGGRRTWMQVRWLLQNGGGEKLKGLGVDPLYFLANSHDGGSSLLGGDCAERIVCANTLRIALSQASISLRLKHTKNAGIRLVDQAKSLFQQIEGDYHNIALHFEGLKKRILTEAEFRTLVLDVAEPMPKAPANPKDRPRFATTLAKVEGRRNRVTALWERGTGHVGDHSAWEAWNGLVEALDHDPDTYKVRGSRLKSIIYGSIADRRQRVFNSLVDSMAPINLG